VVNFDKTILPGGEGKINLKINIAGYSGSIEKNARVFSNDPQNNVEMLTVKAFIKESIQVLPNTLKFKSKEQTVLTQTVELIAQDEKPLNIKAGAFSLKDKMTYTIEEVTKGKTFKILFTNLPQTAGTFSGALQLMTNYNDKPEITIFITGDFFKGTDEINNGK
jgi:hypothetical protein